MRGSLALRCAALGLAAGRLLMPPASHLAPPCCPCLSYWPDNYTADSHHPVWQPEGHTHKLGEFPCYDPKKARAAPPPRPPGATPYCAVLRAMPACLPATGCRAWAHARARSAPLHPSPAFLTGGAAAPICCPSVPLSPQPSRRLPRACLAQDLVLPVMHSAQKYLESPMLGAPTRERRILAFFKGRTQQSNPEYSRGIRQTLENLTRERSGAWVWGRGVVWVRLCVAVASGGALVAAGRRADGWRGRPLVQACWAGRSPA